MANIFETYVKSYPDLESAYEQYKGQQQSGVQDFWEPIGIKHNVGGMAGDYGGGLMTMAQFGHAHWAESGQGEGRSLDAGAAAAKVTADAAAKAAAAATKEDYLKTIQQGAPQVENAGASGGDYLEYVLSNPDLRENAEALGLTQSEMAEWGEQHWNEFGSKVLENRSNTPFAIESPELKTAEWEVGDEVVYEGQTIEDVLQGSIRAQYEGPGPDEVDYQMWEARENIADAWNQGQFTGQGWNMAADVPYGTGILGDTIAVNEDIGQLVPTTTGDQRFLQDRYLDEAIAGDFPVGWTTTENQWAAAAPEQLGNYWDVLTNATRTPEGILRRTEDYDPLTAVGPSVDPGPRGGGNIRIDGTTTGTTTTGIDNVVRGGGGLLGNMYEAAYQPRGLLDWERYQTDPGFVLQENKLANYQPWAEGMGDMGALPVYGTPGGNVRTYSNITGTNTDVYSPIMEEIEKVYTDYVPEGWRTREWGPYTKPPVGSDRAKMEEAGRFFEPNFYLNNQWVGAEGGPTAEHGIDKVTPDTDLSGLFK